MEDNTVPTSKDSRQPVEKAAPQRRTMSKWLLISSTVVVIGSSFLMGFHIGLPGNSTDVSTPSTPPRMFYTFLMIKCFLVQTYPGLATDNSSSKDASDRINCTSDGRKHTVATKSSATWLVTFAVATLVIGQFIGSYIGTSINFRFGRKMSLWLNSLLQLLGSLLMCFSVQADSPVMLIIGRFLVGLHMGITCAISPVYLAEISPVNMRGTIGTLHQLAITIGILLAQIALIPPLFGKARWWATGWGLGLPINAVFMILLHLCPESPRYLFLEKKDVTGAREALCKIRGTSVGVEEELEEMEQERKRESGEAKEDSLSIKQLVMTSSLRLPLLIAVVLQVLQQLSGINAIISYAQKVFDKAGIPASFTPYAVVLVGTVNVIATIVATSLIERLGRRRLLLFPAFTIVIDLVVVTTAFELSDKTPALSFLVLIGVLVFIVCFAVALGPLPFLVVPELFTQRSRGAAMGASQMMNAFCNMVVLVSSLRLTEEIGGFLFLIFAVNVVLCSIFLLMKLPETRNKTYDEIAEALRPKRRRENASVSKRNITP